MRGPLFAIAAGLTYGTLGIFSTLFYRHGGQSFTLLVLRFVGGSLIFGAIVLGRRQPRPSRQAALLAVACGPAQLAATACLFIGFAHSSPGLVVLLFYVYPLLVTLAARPLFGEEIGRRRALLLALGMLGIVLTVGVPHAASLVGIASGLAAGVFTSTFILGSRQVMRRGVDPFQFVALAYGGSAVMLLLAAAVHGVDRPSGARAIWAGAVIVGATVIPALYFYSAIRLIGAGASARLATFEPVTAVILSFLVLGDSLTAEQLAGGALVLVSVVALATSTGSARRGRVPPGPPVDR